MRNAALTIRVDFGACGYLGPGKIALMELISKHGSISAAGKEMGMSYRRAWLLVDEINQIFRDAAGGKADGRAPAAAVPASPSWAATWSAATGPSKGQPPPRLRPILRGAQGVAAQPTIRPSRQRLNVCGPTIAHRSAP